MDSLSFYGKTYIVRNQNRNKNHKVILFPQKYMLRTYSSSHATIYIYMDGGIFVEHTQDVVSERICMKKEESEGAAKDDLPAIDGERKKL